MANIKLPFTSEDLKEASSIGFEIEAVEYFAIKKFGQISIYLNRCPHQGLPLHWQPNVFFDYDKELIQCAVHGALFTAHEGKCIAGPCAGKMLKKIAHKCDSINIFITV